MTQSIDDASIRKLAIEFAKALKQSGLIPQSGNYEHKPSIVKPDTKHTIRKTDLDEHFDDLIRSNEEASKLTQSTVESFHDGFKRSDNEGKRLVERFYKRIDTTRSNKQLFDNFSKLVNTQNKTAFDLTKQTRASSAIFESALGAFTSQAVLQKELPKAINNELAKTNSIFARQIKDLKDVDLMVKTIDQLEQINNRQRELAAYSKELNDINDRIDKNGSVFIRSIEDLHDTAKLNNITGSLSQIDEAITTMSKLVKDYDPMTGIESLAQMTSAGMTGDDYAKISGAYQNKIDTRAKASNQIAQAIKDTLTSIQTAKESGGVSTEQLQDLGSFETQIQNLAKKMDGSSGAITAENTQELKNLISEIGTKLTPELIKMKEATKSGGMAAQYGVANAGAVKGLEQLQIAAKQALNVGAINDAQLETIGMTRDQIDSLMTDIKKNDGKINKAQFEAIKKLSAALGQTLPTELSNLSGGFGKGSASAHSFYTMLKDRTSSMAGRLLNADVAIALFTKALYQGYNDTKVAMTNGVDSFNFWTALTMGVDTSDLHRLIAANKQIALAGGGVEQFTDELKKRQDEIASYVGGDRKLAAEMAASYQTSMRGIGIASKDVIDSMIGNANQNDSMIGSFVNLQRIYGISGEQAMAVQQEMINDVDIRSQLNRLNQKERAEYLKSINLRMVENGLMGLTIEQSKEVIKKFASLAAKSPAERMKAAAKMAALAGATGMGGANASEIMKLTMKGTHITGKENLRLQELTKHMNDRLGNMVKSSDLGQQQLGASLERLVPDDLKGVLGADSPLRTDLMAGNALAQVGINNVTDLRKEAKNFYENNRIAAEIITAIEFARVSLSNPLVSIAGALIAGLVAFKGMKAIGPLLSTGMGKLSTILKGKPPGGDLPNPTNTSPHGPTKPTIPTNTSPHGPTKPTIPTPDTKIPPVGVLSKLVSKVAVVGAAIAAWDAGTRVLDGDFKGAALSVAAGAAPFVGGLAGGIAAPGVGAIPGTIAGLGASLMIMDTLKDHDAALLKTNTMQNAPTTTPAPTVPQTTEISNKSILGDNDKSFLSGLIPKNPQTISVQPAPQPVINKVTPAHVSVNVIPPSTDATLKDKDKSFLSGLIPKNPQTISVQPTPPQPVINKVTPAPVSVNVLPPSTDATLKDKDKSFLSGLIPKNPQTITAQPAPQPIVNKIMPTPITVSPTPVTVLPASVPTPIVNLPSKAFEPAPKIPTMAEPPRTASVDMDKQWKSISNDVNKQLALNQQQEMLIAANTATLTNQMNDLKQMVATMKDAMIEVMNTNQLLLTAITSGQSTNEMLLSKSVALQRKTGWGTN